MVDLNLIDNHLYILFCSLGCNAHKDFYYLFLPIYYLLISIEFLVFYF